MSQLLRMTDEARGLIRALCANCDHNRKRSDIE